MFMAEFNLIFSGEITPDFELNEVKQKFKDHFHLSDIQIQYIFSGKEVILKKNLTEELVLKYALTIDEMGGVSYFEPVSKTLELPEGLIEDRRGGERRKKTERRKVYRAGISAERRVHIDRRKK